MDPKPKRLFSKIVKQDPSKVTLSRASLPSTKQNSRQPGISASMQSQVGGSSRMSQKRVGKVIKISENIQAKHNNGVKDPFGQRIVPQSSKVSTNHSPTRHLKEAGHGLQNSLGAKQGPKAKGSFLYSQMQPTTQAECNNNQVIIQIQTTINNNGEQRPSDPKASSKPKTAGASVFQSSSTRPHRFLPEKMKEPRPKDIPLKHKKDLKQSSPKNGMTHFFAGDGRMTSGDQSDQDTFEDQQQLAGFKQALPKSEKKVFISAENKATVLMPATKEIKEAERTRPKMTEEKLKQSLPLAMQTPSHQSRQNLPVHSHSQKLRSPGLGPEKVEDFRVKQMEIELAEMKEQLFGEVSKIKSRLIQIEKHLKIPVPPPKQGSTDSVKKEFDLVSINKKMLENQSTKKGQLLKINNLLKEDKVDEGNFMTMTMANIQVQEQKKQHQIHILRSEELADSDHENTPLNFDRFTQDSQPLMNLHQGRMNSKKDLADNFPNSFMAGLPSDEQPLELDHLKIVSSGLDKGITDENQEGDPMSQSEEALLLDFDEKLDQRSYIHYNDATRNKSGLRPNPGAEESDDDDAAILSDEVDERRSFTPQPASRSNYDMNTSKPSFKVNFEKKLQKTGKAPGKNEAKHDSAYLDKSLEDDGLQPDTSINNSFLSGLQAILPQNSSFFFLGGGNQKVKPQGAPQTARVHNSQSKTANQSKLEEDVCQMNKSAINVNPIYKSPMRSGFGLQDQPQIGNSLRDYSGQRSVAIQNQNQFGQRKATVGPVMSNAADLIRQVPGTSLGLMSSLKPSQKPSRPVSGDHRQSFKQLDSMQKMASSQSNFGDIMLLKGSKCKCGPIPMTKGSGSARQDPQSPTGYCSSFCKKLGPRDQKLVILECFNLELNCLEESKIILNGKKLEVKASANKLKRYLVEKQWFDKWCDFTNFDFQAMLNADDQDNYFSHSSAKPQKYSKPGRIENSSLFEPSESGPSGGSHGALRPNLVEHYHFEALFPSVWTHLYSWYSADIQVMRPMKVDSINMQEGFQTTKTLDMESERRFDRMMILDLYPASHPQQQ